jgi:hypothetical protein
MSRIRTKEDARRRLAELKRELSDFKDFQAQSEERQRRITHWKRHDWPQLPGDVQVELQAKIREIKEMMDNLPEH